MSELAFDKEGNPFRFSKRTKRLRARRFRNPGKRGTCEAVLDAVTGEQVYVDAGAEFVEFRTAVGNVPALYRLDQCDEDGTPIEDAPPAYVSIESTRNAAPIGDADPRDAIIRDLAQINADVSRTIAERFANVMQAAADILRAADGAGLSRRSPPPPAPVPADDDDEEEDEDEDDEEDHEPEPSEKVWGLIEQMLPTIRVWLNSMAAKRAPSAPPAATPTPAPASDAAPAPAAAPSAAPAPGGAAAGPSPSTSSAPPAASATATAAAPTAATAPAAGSSTPAPATSSPGESIAVATGDGATATEAPRNAPPVVDPTPEQWSHLLAIRARLAPKEAAIAELVVTRMSPEMRAQWLAELSVLTVDQAADVVRSMIPKPAPKPAPRAKHDERAKADDRAQLADGGENGED